MPDLCASLRGPSKKLSKRKSNASRGQLSPTRKNRGLPKACPSRKRDSAQGDPVTQAAKHRGELPAIRHPFLTVTGVNGSQSIEVGVLEFGFDSKSADLQVWHSVPVQPLRDSRPPVTCSGSASRSPLAGLCRKGRLGSASCGWWSSNSDASYERTVIKKTDCRLSLPRPVARERRGS